MTDRRSFARRIGVAVLGVAVLIVAACGDDGSITIDLGATRDIASVEMRVFATPG